MLQCGLFLYYWLGSFNLDLVKSPVQSVAMQMLVVVQRQQWCEVGGAVKRLHGVKPSALPAVLEQLVELRCDHLCCDLDGILSWMLI